MEDSISVINHIILPVVLSVIGALLFNKLMKWRESKIRKKLEAIESEEAFLERLSKGNIRLLRASFLVILACMFLGFTAVGLVLGVLVFELEGGVAKVFYISALSLVICAALICCQHILSLVRISDLSGTRKKFEQKKAKLESQLR